MNALGRYRAEKELSNEAIAEQLSALLGKPMSAAGVALHANRKTTPPAWAKALGLPPDGEPEDETTDSYLFGPEPEPVVGTGTGGQAEPPSPPPGARTFAPPAAHRGGEYSVVRDRIAKFYGAIGAGVSMVSQNDGYGTVADTYSDDLADAWIAAARQNQNVAKIVSFLESGGPVGELVIAHLILVGGMVYVSGRGPALDFLYAGKFSGPRAIATARIAAAAHEASLNGSSQDGSAHPVGDFAGAPTG